MKRCLRNVGLVSTEDRISHLPEALILHILSLPTTKDVVATSVLSKQWRSLWKTVPSLYFDHYSDESEQETFSEIVCRLLLYHKAPFLETLHINFRLDGCDAMDIGMWTGIAYAHHLRKLSLNVESKTESFKFPRSLYNCETLETLILGAWILVDVPSQACLKSLKTLHLYSVDYKDMASVRNLLSGCPNLEELVVFRDQPDVEIFSIAAPSLKRLTIQDENDWKEFGGYAIDAPSLEYLNIEGFKALEFCLFENEPKLVEANIANVSKIIEENILGSLISVIRLSLDLSPLEITFPTGSFFYRLVYLELRAHKAEWWNLLVLMLNASPKLQVLKLIGVSITSPHAQCFYRFSDLMYIVYLSLIGLQQYWSQVGKGNGVSSGKWSQPENVPECLLLHLETFVWKAYKQRLKQEKEVAKYILRKRWRNTSFEESEFLHKSI
ncbi:unnamed protein product [Microthlaspi erraticum]|uniref:F-box domain-containing protein n=1 Tax=Microthlaspi erraticum TaxID=1685480 RepID=A0A6D2JRF1_9BRAS|nr:unnamed protein product [Microthlaspi erraticum]